MVANYSSNPREKKLENSRLVLQDDMLINTDVLYKGAGKHMPTSLKALEKRGLITLSSFEEPGDEAHGIPSRSGLRIGRGTPPASLKEDQVPVLNALCDDTMLELIVHCFHPHRHSYAKFRAPLVDAIEITNFGALQILCLTGENHLHIDGMQDILDAKANAAPRTVDASEAARMGVTAEAAQQRRRPS